MGYNTTITLLLCAPPWVLSTIGSLALSRYSDKKQKRFIYIAASNAVTVLGFVISICTMNTAARYLLSSLVDGRHRRRESRLSRCQFPKWTNQLEDQCTTLLFCQLVA
ncbi:hypothetical protein EDD22DRAFT_530587 [Suillus occidentalis]|nr:hypothetical protein EDD22DRAFT_530587 [Suillus occidentalis]